MNMLGSIPHQKFCFYHLPTRGRAGIKLGDADTSQRIYNFLFFHAVIISFLDVLQTFYNHFIVILYLFLVLTYWHSAKCQLLFFACFLHRRISVPNGVQTQRNFFTSWAKEVPKGGSEGSTTHQTKYWSSRRRVQNHQIQSRHHHGGIHHFHWCLSDEAWVVHCRPTGP